MNADPIADMLTRIRNAVRVGRVEVDVNASHICEGIAQVLRDQGYILDYDRIETAHKQDLLHLKLKYGPLGEKVIHSLARRSKPSCRVYRSVSDLPQIMGGMGIAIVSTSRGVMSDQQCRQMNVGGEVLCEVT